MEGGIGEVSVMRVFGYPQIDAGPRRSPSARSRDIEEPSHFRTPVLCGGCVAPRRKLRTPQRPALAKPRWRLDIPTALRRLRPQQRAMRSHPAQPRLRRLQPLVRRQPALTELR